MIKMGGVVCDTCHTIICSRKNIAPVEKASAVHYCSELCRTQREVALRLKYLERRVKELEGLCAAAYQVVGAVDGPVKMLDNLSAAAMGTELPHVSLKILPWVPKECKCKAQ